MFKAVAVFLVMGALANAAAIARPGPGPGPESLPGASADLEANPISPRGYAEVVAEEIGNIADFTVRITIEASDAGVRGNVADATDLTKDIVSETDVPAVTSNSPQSIVDDLLFNTAMPNFLAAKASNNPPYLIWSDDGCSNSADFPSGFNFLDSCKRHDFGYRNYKYHSRFTEPARLLIDLNFRRDLYNECAKYTGWQSYKGVICRRIADAYYIAVRRYGGL